MSFGLPVSSWRTRAVKWASVSPIPFEAAAVVPHPSLIEPCFHRFVGTIAPSAARAVGAFASLAGGRCVCISLCPAWSSSEAYTFVCRVSVLAYVASLPPPRRCCDPPPSIHILSSRCMYTTGKLQALAKHLEPRPGNAPLRHRLKRFFNLWSDDAASGATAAASAAAAAAAAPASSSPGAAPVAEAPAAVPGRQRQLRLFLQRVPCAAKTPLFWELEGGEPLGTALKGKVRSSTSSVGRKYRVSFPL